jgi:predicted lipoprotein with Yx(FWY)xxD motif
LLFLLPLVVAVAIAGCGGDDSSSSSTGSSAGGGGAYGAPASTPTTTKAPSAAAAGVGVASHGVGTMLVDAQGRTLYLFKADTSSTSTCDGECAQGWPPLTTDGAPKAASGAQAKLLGTSKRSDGTMQVTYAGHPLYHFSGDAAAGQLNGQAVNAFGALWYAVGPDGTAITKTA